MIIRTEEEREILREGGKRLGTILKTLGDMVKPGITTGELEEEARRLIANGGDTAAFLGYTPYGADRPFPAALCISINDAIVHGIPNEKHYSIQDGDIVTVDCGIVHQGLVTDSSVTVIAGEGSEEDVRLVQAVYEALDMAIRTVRAGVLANEVGAAVEAVGKKYGYDIPRELGGHGVGKHVHENPFIPNWNMPGKKTPLRKNMVIAIEPMFAKGSAELVEDSDGYTYRTKDGSRTALAEHTVIVTPDGAEILTKV